MAALPAATLMAPTWSSANKPAPLRCIRLAPRHLASSRYAASPASRLPCLSWQAYTCIMVTLPPVQPRQVGILVLDDDGQGSAIRQILDSEGWRVRVVSNTRLLLAELKSAEWSLVIANVVLMGVEGPAFITLKELASVSVAEGGRLRILFLVPESADSQYVTALEQSRLPYLVRPYHLHDFLERVSDLLVEVKAIDAPLRQVRHEFGALRKKKKQAGRANAMFASRDSFSYTDEEIAEYERQEKETSLSKRNKPRTNLGGSDR